MYLFIYSKIHQACINVYNQYFKNLLYCQPETTKRIVSCFSRLLNLANEQLSICQLLLLTEYFRFCLVILVFGHISLIFFPTAILKKCFNQFNISCYTIIVLCFEPTITWVPSGFSGYIWLDTKIVLKMCIIFSICQNNIIY